MRGRLLSLIPAVVAAVGCREQPPAPAPDAAPRFPALTGSWTGGADQTPHGPARATLFLGPEGWGSVTVMAKGHVVTRRFRIVAWDGREARIEQEGTVFLVGARLVEDELRIDVPGVGEVALRRGAGDR